MNKKRRIRILFFMFFIVSSFNVYGQDIENILNDNTYKVGGSAGMRHVLIHTTDTNNTRKPYSYILDGELNLHLHGMDIPLSFSYSNQELGYSRPFSFNRIGLAPTYKWARLFLGHGSMNFSKYTLAGHQFLGAGAQLTPPIGLETSAMYGRLLKATEEDTTHRRPATYRRMAWAVKNIYRADKYEVGLIVFSAKDDENSIHNRPIYTNTEAKENLAINITGSTQISRRIRLSVDLSQSRVQPVNKPVERIDACRTYTHNKFNLAWNGSLMYSGETGTLGLAYERIDPGYNTLGAYYFVNDLENISITCSKALFNGKLNTAFNLGIENNNLDGDKINTSNRTVTSANINYAPSQRVLLTGTYSNFTSYTNIKTSFDHINAPSPYDNLDTLNFTQISNSAGVQSSFILGDPENRDKRQSLMFGANYQGASSEQQDTVNASNKFYSGNLAYSYGITPIGLNISTSINANLNTIPGMDNRFQFGPTLSLSKTMFEKKLRSMLSSSWNKSYQGGESTARTLGLRLTNTISLKEKHNISLSVVSLHNNREARGGPWTLTCTFGYRYSF